MLFLIGEVPADRGRDAPDLQKSRRNQRLRHFFRQLTGGFGFLFGVIAGHGLKRRVHAVPVFQANRRYECLWRFGVAAHLAELYELVAFGEGKRLEQDCVDCGEYGAVRADAEREGENYCDRKRWRFAEESKCGFEICLRGIEKLYAIDVAQFFLDLFAAAEFELRLAARFGGAHPSGDVFIRERVDVKAQLRIKLRISRGFLSAATLETKKFSPTHCNPLLRLRCDYCAVCMICVTACARRSQFDSSACNCLRPFGDNLKNLPCRPFSDSPHSAVSHPRFSRRCSAGYKDPC